jgi:CheY-like chemotaxis protein
MSTPIILVVEDNPTQQYVLQQLLKKFDYDAQVVSSGEEAITAIGVSNYAAILMDVTLPGINGFECTKCIRRLELASGRRIPVIAVTARAERKDQEDCMASGMDAYISKPFDPEQLRKVLLRYVYDPAQPNLKTLRPLPPEELAGEEFYGGVLSSSELPAFNQD